ncbi:MAG: ATP-binding protein [DPANN group archaeon]|nr:ATP-binding protein [DPANN group archaeon]
MTEPTIYGTVITTEDSPSVSGFAFVIHSENSGVKRGQFVSVKTVEGTAIATISNIFKTNKYFESAGSVREYSKTTEMYTAFPIKEWEYTVAETKLLGVYTKDGMLNRPSFPPSPGIEVTEVDLQMLNRFLGLDQERGIDLGEIQQHSLRAKFNLTKMIQKHMAILAISGAGKSYATAVFIEELLSRDPKQGRVALFVVDNHGEYVSFADDPDFKERINIIDGEDVRLAVKNTGERMFAALLPEMSPVQIRELGKVLHHLKNEKHTFELKDVVDAVKDSEDIKKASKDALVGWLSELEDLKIFAQDDYPGYENLLEQGKMVILNLRNVLDLRRKQLIVRQFSTKFFNLRREGKVPPYLEIIEEAHNFCPEGTRSSEALSRHIIELLAREGRKFYANLCLISQRPVQLSTTALSQCNTQIILKITNPYDLDHIKKSSEAISQSTLDIVNSLKVGEGLVIGEAVNYPVFIKVRKRKSKESHGTKLEDYAIMYEKKENKLATGKEFL